VRVYAALSKKKRKKEKKEDMYRINLFAFIYSTLTLSPPPLSLSLSLSLSISIFSRPCRTIVADGEAAVRPQRRNANTIRARIRRVDLT
jgi:hypothetical protein